MRVLPIMLGAYSARWGVTCSCISASKSFPPGNTQAHPHHAGPKGDGNVNR